MQKKLPPKGDLVFEGKYSQYFLSDLAQLPRVKVDTYLAAEKAFEKMHFTFCGDLVMSVYEVLVVRCYASEEGKAWALHCQATDGSAYSEYLSTLADGASLTSSTGDMGGDELDVRIFRTIRPDLNEQSLYTAHLKRLEELERDRETSATICDKSLASIARAMESFPERRSRM